ncbi:MAG: VWA domain-containing protein [Bryobacteraceae bacterium]
MSISRRHLLAMLHAFPAAKLLIAQQSAGPAARTSVAETNSRNPKFSTDVKVVNLFATVRDKEGHIVSNLSKEDFTLQEDGRPQVIRYFSRESDLPLTLGLLVDTSLSQRQVIEQERTASYTFLEHVLREDKDHAFVLHFDREVELLQDLTASRQKLEKALQELEVAKPQSGQNGGNSGGGQSGGGGGGYPGGGYPGGGYPGGGIGFPGGRRRYPGGGYPGGGYPGGGQRGDGRLRQRAGTTLYDAVLLASDDLMKKQAGRKALLVLSDGVDHGSKVPISEAIEAAQRSDSLVYSIYFTGNEGGRFGGPGMGRRGGMPRSGEERPDGKKVLQRISKETGGGYFEVSKKEPIDKIYERIQEELRNQYSLGYTSDQPESEGAFRHIALTANKKGMIVQTREGYYPVSAKSPAS